MDKLGYVELAYNPKLSMAWYNISLFVAYTKFVGPYDYSV